MNGMKEKDVTSWKNKLKCFIWTKVYNKIPLFDLLIFSIHIKIIPSLIFTENNLHTLI